MCRRSGGLPPSTLGGSVGLFKILTFIGATIGLLIVLLSFSMSAPQQGAAAGVALFLVIAPYCVNGVIHRSRRD